MYAVIEAGGKQYRVFPGASVRVESIAGEIGTEIELGRVLAVSKEDGQLSLGADIADAKVKGTIQSHGRGDKTIVFKFKRKKQYKRTIGHRQNYTEIQVTDIQA